MTVHVHCCPCRFSKRARQVGAAAAAAAARKAPAARNPHAAFPAAPAVAPAAALTPLQALLAVCECDDLLAPVAAVLKVSDVLDPPTAMRALELLQPIERDVRRLVNVRNVRRVQADLFNVVLPAVQMLAGQHDWLAAQEYFAMSEDIQNPKLHQAVADALGRCQPAAPSAGNVRVLLDALVRCGAPPSDQQWEALCNAACRPSAAAGLGAKFVLEVLAKAEMFTSTSDTFLSRGACSALQALFEHLVALLDAGTATIKQAVETVGLSSKLLLMPEPLVTRLDVLSEQQISDLSWKQVHTLLNALAKLGCGQHHSRDQGGMRQPMELLRKLLGSCLSRVRAGDPPRPWMACSLARVVAYLDLDKRVAVEVVDTMCELGEADASDTSRHQLYQAQTWLRARGHKYTREVDLTRLKQVRERLISAGRTSNANRAMQRLLLELQDSYPGLIFNVSDCEVVLRCGHLIISVDCVFKNRRGEWVVVEFDGPSHRVGPRGSLSGATMWRNLVLRKNGYKVVTINSSQWDHMDRVGHKILLMQELKSTCRGCPRSHYQVHSWGASVPAVVRGKLQ